MKRKSLFPAKHGCALLVLLVAWAVCAPAHGEGWGGFLQLDHRFGVHEWMAEKRFDTPIQEMYHKAQLGYETWLGRRLKTVVSAQLRFYDHTLATDLHGMTRPEQQMEFQFLPWELFFKAHDVLLEGLDLSLGKQRIVWGKADRLNPTDRLNPPDLSDIFDFGARVPSYAALVSYTFPNDFSLSAVWLPTMQPALLYRPLDLSLLVADPGEMQRNLEAELARRYPQWAAMMDSNLANIFLDSYSQSFHPPPRNLRHSMMGARFAFHLFDMDFSVSYFNGYESIPVPTTIRLTADASGVFGGGTDPSRSGIPASVQVEGGYVETHVVGFDLAGELWGMGYWGEWALVFPRAMDTRFCLDLGPGMNDQMNHDPQEALYTQSTVKDQPYLQFTLGVDYMFPFGLYMNLQYAHGMAYELGTDNQNDYLIAKFDKNFFRDSLRLTLQGGMVVAKWSDLENNHGYLANPEVGYRPFDNLEFRVGAYLLGGRGSGLFAMLKEHDQLYLRAVARF